MRSTDLFFLDRISIVFLSDSSRGTSVSTITGTIVVVRGTIVILVVCFAKSKKKKENQLFVKNGGKMENKMNVEKITYNDCHCCCCTRSWMY